MVKFYVYYVSLDLQNWDYCLCENNLAQISCAVTVKLISAFVFVTRIVQFLFFLNPKFPASSHLQLLHRPVFVRPARKHLRPVFSLRSSCNTYLFVLIPICPSQKTFRNDKTEPLFPGHFYQNYQNQMCPAQVSNMVVVHVGPYPILFLQTLITQYHSHCSTSIVIENELSTSLAIVVSTWSVILHCSWARQLTSTRCTTINMEIFLGRSKQHPL